MTEPKNICNICIAGHSQTGKTTLAEALLHDGGTIPRLGQVENGSSTMDYDDDEKERKFSISASLGYVEKDDKVINLIDLPGYFDFFGDCIACIPFASTLMAAVSAHDGLEIGTERVWKMADKYTIPKVVVVTKLNKENSDFYKTLIGIQERYGKQCVAITLPVKEGDKVTGVYSLLSSEDAPAGVENVDTIKEQLIEAAAETDDALMEKFFEEGSLTEEELGTGISNGLKEGSLIPVFATDALDNVGVNEILDFMLSWLPGAEGKLPITAKNGEEDVEVAVDPNGPFIGYVFKCTVDPFVGKINFVKVCSGKLKSDSEVKNLTKRGSEKIGKMHRCVGKELKDISEACAGDIVALSKLKDTDLGDTLSDGSFDSLFEPIQMPQAMLSKSIKGKSKKDEDKIGEALAKLSEEDPCFTSRMDPQTRELVIAGMGDMHVQVMVNRLKARYGIEVELGRPKIPYKETFSVSADVNYRHKKQTGGSGQFGEVYIRVNPAERGVGFVFKNSIVGGAISKGYIPAVEKGILEKSAAGVLAGYPLVDFEVELYDGKEHSVDSSEMAFKLAASKALDVAAQKAKPILLEPIVNMEIVVPGEFMGDISGGISGKRGRIQGMDAEGTNQIIKAQVPLSEVTDYSGELNSITAGKGTFSIEFSHYEPVPNQIAQKIIDASKTQNKEE